MSDYYFVDTISNQPSFNFSTNFSNFRFEEYILEPFNLNSTDDLSFELTLDQFKIPIFYILSIIFTYILIVAMIFLSAIFSNRKRDDLYDLDNENSSFCVSDNYNEFKNETTLLLDESDQESSISNWFNFLNKFKTYKPVRLDKLTEYSL